MKKNMLFLATLAVLFTACGGDKNESLAGKKETLAQLKTDQKDIEKQIKTLESEIAAQDSTVVVEAKVKAVTVATLAPQTFKHYVELQGMVDAKNSILVTPKTGGVITSMNVKEGDYVKAGSVIGRIDDSILRETIEELKTQLSLINTLFDKQKSLWDQKIGTELQYLQAKNNKESLERKMATLKVQLAQNTIVAPMAGVVDLVNVRVGEMASPGMGVVRVVNLNNLKVVAKVSDVLAGTVRKGDEVVVTFPGMDKEYTARISFVSTTVDPLSRTFSIEANLPSDKSLKPNMSVKLQINDTTHNDALVVDQNYVQSTERGQIIYVATTQGDKKIAKSKTVKTGLNYNGKIEVVEGLEAGDQLITMGYQEVADGQVISY